MKLMPPTRCAAWLPALLLLALLAPRAAADVLVVDVAGGAEHTSLTAAIQAAHSGDVVLVRPGDYTGQGFGGGALLVLGKSIAVVADGSGPVITGPIAVQSTPAGGTVLLRGLTVQPPNQQGDTPGLALQSNSGRVWAEDCVFVGKHGFFTLGAVPASPGVRINSSSDVVLVRCTAQGGQGVDSFFPYAATPGRGGEGLAGSGLGHIMLHECTLTGGAGGDFVGFDGGLGPGGNGGDAVWTPGVNLLVSGCTLTGGDAGSGDELVPNSNFYRGGDGLEAVGNAYVRVCDSAITPGAGGAYAGGTGPDGQALKVPTGTLIPYSGTHRSFAVSGPTPENTDVTLTYQGLPGDLVGVYLSLSTLSLPLLYNQGTWVLDAPVLGPYVLGTVGDPSGELQLVFGVPDFGFGPEDAVVLYEQVFLQAANGKLILSSPSTHVIVDGSL